MTAVFLGETVAYRFTCTNSAGALFNPDVVQVSLVKDHHAGDPTTSLYEDALTYLGSEPKDSQLVKIATGTYVFSYAVDRVGDWSCLPRWTDADLPTGGMKTSRTPIFFTVVPTEHQFVDREAMIPPDGGDPVSVPYATPTTGGMLTDAMAARFAGLPLNYYVANWAVTDWYLDSVAGSDSNAGTSELAALATADELTRRLAVSLPVDHSVTVHLAAGSHGTLAVRAMFTDDACSLLYDGIPALVVSDVAAAWTAFSHTTADGTYLTGTAITDWTAHVGRRVRRTLDSSVCVVLQVSPLGLGVGVALTSVPVTVPGGVRATWTAGDAFVVEDLPVVEATSQTVVSDAGALYSATSAPAVLRSLKITQCARFDTANRAARIQGCVLLGAVNDLNPTSSQTHPSVTGCLIDGAKYTGPARLMATYCGIKSSAATPLLDVDEGYLYRCTVVATMVRVAANSTPYSIADSQFIGAAGNPAIQMSAGARVSFTTGVSGKGPLVGIRMIVRDATIYYPTAGIVFNLQPVGATFECPGFSLESDPSTAWPKLANYNDGEQHGVATLNGSGVAVVNVTNPFVFPYQKVICSLNTSSSGTSIPPSAPQALYADRQFQLVGSPGDTVDWSITPLAWRTFVQSV